MFSIATGRAILKWWPRAKSLDVAQLAPHACGNTWVLWTSVRVTVAAGGVPVPVPHYMHCCDGVGQHRIAIPVLQGIFGSDARIISMRFKTFFYPCGRGLGLMVRPSWT